MGNKKLVQYIEELSGIYSTNSLLENIFDIWKRVLDFDKGILTVELSDRSFCITNGIPQGMMKNYLSREDSSHLVKSVILEDRIRRVSEVMDECKSYRQFAEQVLVPVGANWGIAGPIKQGNYVKGCIRVLRGDEKGEIEKEEEQLFKVLLASFNQAFTHLAFLEQREQKPPDYLGDKILQLTNREKETLDLMLQGMSNIEIAIELGIKERTVKAHVSKILEKLDASDRTQVIVMFLKTN
ncbi:DNA-binding CsgD family transcriptional regulator [Desulfitispora alkaliphila]|uniref:response regulator transcription factor n=1 Tax=Desulfitispora alkaliphila TaxID=622674 RepID=UPI003D21E508